MWRPCVLARARLPVAVSVGAGGSGRGGARRTGLAAFLPQAPRPSRREGGLPPGLAGGQRAGASLARLRHAVGRRRGSGGRGGGRGRVVVPRHTRQGGWSVAPGPGRPLCHAAWRRASPPAACLAWAVWQPRAPGAVWPAAGRSVWRGGGWSVRRLSSGARPGGPAGRGAGKSLCCGPSPRPPRAGTKAGRFVIPPPSKLHWLSSACRRPGEAHGVPFRAGAGLPACCGYCWSGQAADWRHTAYGSAYRGSGASLGVATLSSGVGGGVPPPGPAGWVRRCRLLGRPPAVHGSGGGGGVRG